MLPKLRRFAVLAVLLVAAAVLPASQPTSAAPSPLTILTVGDSITSGPTGGVTDSYRGQLGADLTADGVQYTFQVRAVSGAPCRDLATSFGQWLVDTQPNVVIIMCGANDARLGLARSATRSALDSMAAAATTFATHPATYIAYIPYDYVVAVGQTKVDREADVNNAVADVTTTDYPYVTAAINLTDVPGDRFYRISDGVHPTQLGYNAIGREIARNGYVRSAVGDTAPVPAQLCGMYGRYWTNAEPSFTPCTTVS